MFIAQTLNRNTHIQNKVIFLTTMAWSQCSCSSYYTSNIVVLRYNRVFVLFHRQSDSRKHWCFSYDHPTSVIVDRNLANAGGTLRCLFSVRLSCSAYYGKTDFRGSQTLLRPIRNLLASEKFTSRRVLCICLLLNLLSGSLSTRKEKGWFSWDFLS